MMSIDEAALGRGRFAEIPFPPEHWQEMVRCVASLGLQVHLAGSPPAVILVPVACTIRVHDLTLDSLLYAEDSTYFGEHWNSPTVGYALVRSNVILATEPYRQNKYLLRHEALHHLVWRIRRQMGHPEYVFGPCDKRYGG